MKLFESCWAFAASFLDFLTLSPWSNGPQVPLSPIHNIDAYRHTKLSGGPVFSPPNVRRGSSFQCDYSGMGRGWESCSTSNDRSCWLQGPGSKFDINTDYENLAPTGITRKYYLNATQYPINADGVMNLDSKAFNKTYPGPWIEACWGDTIEVTVENFLDFNGTGIHWHGIRQFETNEEDGVNGVTQCPIAPGDKYTYRFKAGQYGTSWYHSHYALQYGDGLAGPLTIYGPSSGNYDEAQDPLLMTDWNHRSPFRDFYLELGLETSHPPFRSQNRTPPKMKSILLNGKGNYVCPNPPDPYQGCRVDNAPSLSEMIFEKGKRYLLRLINTSVDSTFVFAIDNHDLWVISSDFVPITPYKAIDGSVLVGIGQRYHVIAVAKPVNQTKPNPTDDYWIRAVPAQGCTTFENVNIDSRVGIVRYNPTSTARPTTLQAPFPTNCSDEPYELLKPILPWKIGPMANDMLGNNTFNVELRNSSLPPDAPWPHGNLPRWELGGTPMWLNFSDPTINHLDSTNFSTEWVVIPEDYPKDSWIYLLITGRRFETPPPRSVFIPAAHPIHLHGHDFALLQQSNVTFNASVPLNLNLWNPPRRDVALLPQNGFLVIAFKADNPGSWLMHCHIAWHASSGLALQILERRGDIKIGNRNEINRVCDNWNKWSSNSTNWWDDTQFQDDSGI